ncbi:MAG: hypothetical protein GXO32_05005 [Crenarchaeota archaeon]|nr:hypothetical protein [Thermoproteota archaeon]
MRIVAVCVDESTVLALWCLRKYSFIGYLVSDDLETYLLLNASPKEVAIFAEYMGDQKLLSRDEEVSRLSEDWIAVPVIGELPEAPRSVWARDVEVRRDLGIHVVGEILLRLPYTAIAAAELRGGKCVEVLAPLDPQTKASRLGICSYLNDALGRDFLDVADVAHEIRRTVRDLGRSSNWIPRAIIASFGDLEGAAMYVARSGAVVARLEVDLGAGYLLRNATENDVLFVMREAIRSGADIEESFLTRYNLAQKPPKLLSETMKDEEAVRRLAEASRKDWLVVPARNVDRLYENLEKYFADSVRWDEETRIGTARSVYTPPPYRGIAVVERIDQQRYRRLLIPSNPSTSVVLENRSCGQKCIDSWKIGHFEGYMIVTTIGRFVGDEP